MAFQIKNAVSVTAAIINRIKATTQKITDFNVGSVVRTIVEAVATEIDQFYQQVFNGIKDAIPVAVFNTFNFSALPPGAATGAISVTITAAGTDTTIPAGTIFGYSGGQVTYSNINPITILAGNTVGAVPVVASLTGPVGNIAAGVMFTAIPAIPGFVSATNLKAFVNGRDAETNTQRKTRFNEFIRGISKSTNDGIKYGAETTVLIDDTTGVVAEVVASASVVEPYESDTAQPVGLFKVYIHNGVGNTSDQLVSQCQVVLYGYVDAAGNKVPGYKAAGTHVDVYKATETNINVTGVITAAPGYDAGAIAAQAAMVTSEYIRGLPIDDKYEFTQNIFLVRSIPGVADYVQSAPTANQASDATHKLMPGIIDIT